jgi:rhodanese-related sulfurtransferase
MKNITCFFSLVLFALLFSNCSDSQVSNFEMPVEEALQQAVSGELLLSPQGYADLVKSTGGDVTLVDLRQPIKYDQGHLPDAINIPENHLLEEDQMELLESSKAIVFYGEDAFQASGPCMLLSQMGLENVKMLEVGYADFNAEIDAPTPETARYDYAAVFQKAIERHAKEVAAGKAKPVVVTRPAAPQKKTIVPVKKAKKVVEEEEGC